MFGLFRRRTYERAGYALYTEAVRAARAPAFYTAWAVPDTLDGRFDLVSLHVGLLVNRLRGDAEPGPALAQAVFDAMFADMDFTLREMGVGDMSVGKRNKEMWEAFHGRAIAYDSAVAEGGEALVEVLRRNVWRGAEPPPGAAAGMVAHALAVHAALAATPLERLRAGEVGFPTPDLSVRSPSPPESITA